MELREKQGGFKAWSNMAARLPWWLGLALAVLAYVGLHHLAQKPPGTPQPGQTQGFVLSAATYVLAMAGQYLLPLWFGSGALLSAWRRGKTARLHAVAAAGRPDTLNAVSWQDFEILVGEYFRRQGYGVTDNGGGGADGGVDVVLQGDDGTYLVQCKHWRALRVGVQPVRELYGVMAAHGSVGGFVVTSGEFTEEALRFADGLALTLINGSTLLRGIRAQTGSSLAATAPADLSTPDCPVCGAAMVRRQARTGANAGRQFWGCRRFAQDRCRGTRKVN